MRVPTYGGVISFAAFLGVAAFVGVLIIGAPRESERGRVRTRGATAQVDAPPSDPDELEEWLARNPDSPRRWLELGNARFTRGFDEEARRAWREALRLYEERLSRGDKLPRGALYNLACCRARLGDREGAIEGLRRAVAEGWGDPEHTRTDPDLESLRNDPRFQEIIRTMPERPRLFNAG